MFGEKQIATIKMSPRVAVWGGSGFIGSRVCQLLATCGCECISLSRSGGPPAWAVGEAWTADVTWLVADASNGPRHAPGALGQIDAAVSCVGNMRPSSEWEGFWDSTGSTRPAIKIVPSPRALATNSCCAAPFSAPILPCRLQGSCPNHHELNSELTLRCCLQNPLTARRSDETMRRENGEFNEAIAEAAVAVGARRFVLASISSDLRDAYSGALEGYVDGKMTAEAAARDRFDGSCLIVGATLVCGGGRGGAWLPGLFASPLVRAAVGVNEFLSGLSVSSDGRNPEMLALRVALAPPVTADDLALVLAAGSLGKEIGFVDGEAEIRELASRIHATDGSLGRAAAALAAGRVDHAHSEEAALAGYRPLLFPMPVVLVTAGIIGWATSHTAVPPS